jgi:hypothetical protein
MQASTPARPPRAAGLGVSGWFVRAKRAPVRVQPPSSRVRACGCARQHNKLNPCSAEVLLSMRRVDNVCLASDGLTKGFDSWFHL